MSYYDHYQEEDKRIMSDAHGDYVKLVTKNKEA